MRIINRLRRPGEIRSVKLNPESVIVRTTDNEVIIYRKVDYVGLPHEKEVRK